MGYPGYPEPELGLTPPVSDCSLCAINPTPPTTHSYHTLVTICMYTYLHTFRDTHTNHTHTHTHTYQTTYMYTFTLTPHCQEEAEDKAAIAMSTENWGSVVT